MADSSTVVSIVTPQYHELLQINKPWFYDYFKYTSVESSLRYGEINSLLPFILYNNEFLPVSTSQLHEAEVLHLQSHLSIINLYKENNLTAIPPWHHLDNASLCPNLRNKITHLISDLEKSVISLGGLALTGGRKK